MRMGSHVQGISKCLMEIGNKPIIHHLLQYYSYYGHSSFILCLGQYSHQIKSYFLEYETRNRDMTVDMRTGNVTLHGWSDINWEVTLVDTGLESQTGWRLSQVYKYLGEDETFLVNYADGLSDVDINNVIKFHQRSGKLATLTAVHPVSRFGELEIISNEVRNFVEKPIEKEWINGGYFVMNRGIFKYNDPGAIEVGLLPNLSREKQLGAYNHEGFFSPCDSPKEVDYLNSLVKQRQAPWMLIDSYV